MYSLLSQETVIVRFLVEDDKAVIDVAERKKERTGLLVRRNNFSSYCSTNIWARAGLPWQHHQSVCALYC